MQNLSSAVNYYRIQVETTRLYAIQSQAENKYPLTPLVLNPSGSIVVFYKKLNKLFYLGKNSSSYNFVLNECYQYFLKLENEGWVIENRYLKNLVFENCIQKIEILVDVFFNRYAMQGDYSWLDKSVVEMLDEDLKLLQHYRKQSKVLSATLIQFEKLISNFPEWSLSSFTQLKLEKYKEFLEWSINNSTFDYKNCVYFNGLKLHSTEINVPCLEFDLAEIVYKKMRSLGIEYAKRNFNSNTALDAFRKEFGL